MSKITDLTALTAADAADVLAAVDVDDTTMAASGTTKKITAQNLLGTSVLRDLFIRSSTILAESTPRSCMVNSTAAALTSGTLYMVPVAMWTGSVVGHIDFVTGTAGATSPTHWWFGLYDSSLNQLAVTADQTSTAWANATYKHVSIATIASGASSTFTTTYTGLYYCGIMMAATTPVSLMFAGHASNILSSQGSPFLFSTSDTSQTTPPAFPHTAAALTQATPSGIPYCAVTT